eukprot:5510185-Alexandrium_andersonii.AAC.1
MTKLELAGDGFDELELQSYTERLLFVECRLGLEKHRALAQAASEAPMGMEVGALEPEPRRGISIR